MPNSHNLLVRSAGMPRNRPLMVSVAVTLAMSFVAPGQLVAQVTTPDVGSGSTGATCRQRVIAGSNRFACGSGSVATGNHSTAVGVAARALANSSTAIGENARATGVNSVALGRSSVANVANVVSVGGVGAERRIINVSAGTIAAGSTNAVNGGQLFTTNQNLAILQGSMVMLQGDVATLQTDLAMEAATRASTDATLQSIINAEAAIRAAADAALAGADSTLQSNIDAEAMSRAVADMQHTADITTLNAVTAVLASQVSTLNTDIVSLGGRVALLESDVQELYEMRREDRKDMKQGIAAAVAIVSAPMPSEPGRISYSLNGSAFRGELGVGGSMNYRLRTQAPMAVEVGVSHAGGKNTALRVGVAGEF